MLPALLFNGIGNSIEAKSGTFMHSFGGFMSDLGNMFGNGTSLVYNLCYAGMIYFFCYFWTSIIFNPKEISDNLKRTGTFIAGYR